MTKQFTDIAFPLHNTGHSARLGDRIPMRLLSLSGCTIDKLWGHYGKSDMTSPFWRIYQNFDNGTEAIVGGKVYPLKAGEVWVLPAWLLWRGKTSFPVRHGNALFDLPAFGSRERIESLFNSPLRLATADEPLAVSGQALFSSLSAIKLADEILEARAYAWVWQVIEKMLTKMNQPLHLGHSDFAFSSLLFYIDKNLSEDLDRPELAKRLGCSETELAREFQKHCGMPPARYIRERRLILAASLLKQTNANLDAIARQTGLGDRTSFSKLFSKTFGNTPAAWRKNTT